MRLILRLLGGAVLLAVLLAAVALADLVFNERRLTYVALGRDQLVAACRPPLIARLVEAGFQPDDVVFGPAPDIAVSTTTGRTLTDSFTFADGSLRSRVDGLLACGVRGTTVTVEVRTRSTPLRAT